MAKRPPPSTPTGNVLVSVTGGRLDDELVRLGCSLAGHRGAKIYVIYVLEVPQRLAVDAEMDTTQAEAALDHASAVGESFGVEVTAELLQARDAGIAIVDEARDRQCGLILMGLVPDERRDHNPLGRRVPYVLIHADCRVIVVREKA